MKKTILMLALFSLIVGLTSCQKAEEITVTKYFQAMQHDDKETMQTMAVEPKAFKFKSFKIEKVEPAVTQPLEFPELQKKVADLEQKKKDQQKMASDKNDDFEALKDQVGGKAKGDAAKKLADAEAAAVAEKEKYLSLSKELSQAKKKVEVEKALITSSAGIEKDHELYTGETSIVKVFVKVTMLNDEVKDYVFILRKNTLKKEGESRPINGRMVIIKIGTPDEIDKAAVEPQTVTETKPADGK